MNKLLILTVIICFFVSCEIDKAPYDSLTDSFYWKTESDLAMASNVLYTSLEAHTNRDVFSEIAYGASPNEISSGTYMPSNSFGPWENAYLQIARCNKIIEGAVLANEIIEKDIIDRYIGEARFFRAYHYYDLLRSYGGVPIIEKLLDLDSDEVFGARDNRLDVVEFILNDLDFAANNLPDENQMSNSEQGRLTRSAALTLKSRVALYEGTRQKFHENGEFEELLNVAKNAALSVINSEQHKLFTYNTNNDVDNYRYLFIHEGENSSESILANRYVLPWRNHNRSQQLIRGNGNLPTRKMIDSYLCTDGLPIQYSPLFQGYETGISEFIDRDPRLKASVFVPHEDDWWKTGKKYIPDFGYGSGTTTGYNWKKYVIIDDANTFEGDNDYMVIRYAEALLNYAEAVYELNESISDEDLNISVNKLRDRVGMPHLTNSFVNGANSANITLNMREEIRRERLVELSNEGFRYDDLLRWGIAPEVLTEPIKGIKDIGDEYPLVSWKNWEKDDSGFIIIQKASQRFFNDKNWLWPIPLVQISLNSNLEQNPGW